VFLSQVFVHTVAGDTGGADEDQRVVIAGAFVLRSPVDITAPEVKTETQTREYMDLVHPGRWWCGWRCREKNTQSTGYEKTN